ncbi:MAG: hypothetical protein HRU75_09965 [Planctomycetia bacterium]|nr:MAG: hypothetical protein HRU75_09965 [Planctomycetia bacterium]
MTDLHRRRSAGADAPSARFLLGRRGGFVGRCKAEVWLALALVAGIAAGCAEPAKDPYAGVGRPPSVAVAPPAYIDVMAVPVRDDIVSVQCFWSAVPWIQDSATGKTVGFRVLTYFVSRDTEKGAFVSNPVVLSMSRIGMDAAGDFVREPLHEWTLDQVAATGFRVRKRAVGGYYYGFVLRWPPNVDPSGKRIEVQIGYRRADGVLVQSTPRGFDVPMPAVQRPRGFKPPSSTTSVAPLGGAAPPPSLTPARE